MQHNQNQQNIASRFSAITGADKKKTAFALGLIVLMIVMWVKVFSGDGPKKAEAKNTANQILAVTVKPKTKISYIQLPILKGRNENICRDMFFVKNWEQFIRNNTEVNTEVNLVTGSSGDEKYIEEIMRKLSLKAILPGPEPQVFINDSLLSKGDILNVRVETSNVKCQIMEIEEESVIVKCQDNEIELKLIQPVKRSN